MGKTQECLYTSKPVQIQAKNIYSGSRMKCNVQDGLKIEEKQVMLGKGILELQFAAINARKAFFCLCLR